MTGTNCGQFFPPDFFRCSLPLPKPIERQAMSPKTSTTGNPGPSLEVQLGNRPEGESINNSPGEDEVSATTDEYASVGGDEEEDPSVVVEEP